MKPTDEEARNILPALGAYEAFINAADFVSILKLKAQRQLDSNRS